MTKRSPHPTTIPVNGTALRKLRMERGIEVAELATTCRISRPYMTQIETGQRKRVSLRVFKALLEALQPNSRNDLIDDDEMAGSAA